MYQPVITIYTLIILRVLPILLTSWILLLDIDRHPIPNMTGGLVGLTPAGAGSDLEEMLTVTLDFPEELLPPT